MGYRQSTILQGGHWQLSTSLTVITASSDNNWKHGRLEVLLPVFYRTHLRVLLIRTKLDYIINRARPSVAFKILAVFRVSFTTGHLMQRVLRISVVVFAVVAFGASKPGVLKQIQDLEDSNSSLLLYPTQFTQDIVPKNIHSHNDYWREVPLLTSLSYGVGSVEADVWLVNGTLYVGHERQALTSARTFQSLNVQPLLGILQGQNPNTPFFTSQSGKNGVWDRDSGRTLQLLVDLKTDGNQTLPYVISELQPLRDYGYLTTFENGVLTPGPITVVGTGNTPLEGVKQLTRRDVFYDAPLTDLTNTADTTWNVSLSPTASTDYAVAVGWDGISPITPEQRSTIQQLVQHANSLGIRARFWDTPGQFSLGRQFGRSCYSVEISG